MTRVQVLLNDTEMEEEEEGSEISDIANSNKTHLAKKNKRSKKSKKRKNPSVQDLKCRVSQLMQVREKWIFGFDSTEPMTYLA